jgi:hypothetical protein
MRPGCVLKGGCYGGDGCILGGWISRDGLGSDVLEDLEV